MLNNKVYVYIYNLNKKILYFSAPMYLYKEPKPDYDGIHDSYEYYVRKLDGVQYIVDKNEGVVRQMKLNNGTSQKETNLIIWFRTPDSTKAEVEINKYIKDLQNEADNGV